MPRSLTRSLFTAFALAVVSAVATPGGGSALAVTAAPDARAAPSAALAAEQTQLAQVQLVQDRRFRRDERFRRDDRSRRNERWRDPDRSRSRPRYAQPRHDQRRYNQRYYGDRHRSRRPGFDHFYLGWWYLVPWWTQRFTDNDRCSYWHSQCVRNWGYANPNYDGCMRYYGCD